MMKVIATAILLQIVTTAFAAEGPETRTLRGSAQRSDEAAATLGSHGAWLVESEQRWDDVLKTLATFGTRIDDHLGKIDWTTESIACVFHLGDQGDQFSVRKIGGDATLRDVDLAMSYIIYKQHIAMPLVWKLFAVPVSKAAATKVFVSTFHPMNGGPYPTIDKANAEWEWTFSQKTGEDIGGLTGMIEPKAAIVKAREDIQIKFVLLAADGARGESGKFTGLQSVIRVWDGKYSEGYRNHAFEVITPDGKSLSLRPAVINDWEKNAPHPVAIKTGEPYVLPSWREEQGFKSLKDLGLDTSKVGVYVITGIYAEGDQPRTANILATWGGILRTNAIRVEVK